MLKHTFNWRTPKIEKITVICGYGSEYAQRINWLETWFFFLWSSKFKLIVQYCVIKSDENHIIYRWTISSTNTFYLCCMMLLVSYTHCYCFCYWCWCWWWCECAWHDVCHTRNIFYRLSFCILPQWSRKLRSQGFSAHHHTQL